MKSATKIFSSAAILFLCSSNLQAAEYATFESFYSTTSSIWLWTAIIAGTIAVVVTAWFTVGAPIPAWIATVGAWIGSTVGLSGAAAVNFGLALLGGGPIAAGGLGILGGAAVLTVAMSFSAGVAISYGTDVATEAWNYSKFVEANKEMTTLPVPRNTKGGIAYRTAVSYLKEHFKADKPISDPENQHVLKRASEILFEKMQSEKDEEYILKNKTLLALLYLQTNQYALASDMARQAVTLAHDIKETCTLPSFVWALSEIATPEKNCTDEVVHALRVAYYHETDNKLIPIMTGSLMDRMMYRYHFGQLHINNLSYLCGIITNEKIDKELAAASLEIFVTRGLIELKRTQQDIRIATRDKSAMKNASTVAELRNRYHRHKTLISLLQKEALPQVYRLEKEFPKESKLTAAMLTSLLDSYYNELADLEKSIR